MPRDILHVHFVADPFGPEAFVFFVPEAAIVGDTWVFFAAFVLSTMWAVLVDFVGGAAAAVTRFATASGRAAVFGCFLAGSM